jgi:N6-L-threonylcarbamoyladenine synthase
MRILAIESSCDETAAAVLEDGSRVLSNVVASQLALHAKYGGVVPELASREHLRAVVPVVREALSKAVIGFADLSAVAATSGPGLAGALLVGLTYAKAISFATGIPLIAVHHIEGHIYGNPLAVPFTLARMKGNTLDFSFSGLKTGVLRWVESHGLEAEIEARRVLLRREASPSVKEWLSVTPRATLDLLAGFQHTVIEELLGHAAAAAGQMEDVRSIVITGGVACNAGLRAAAGYQWAGLPVYFPTPALSTDNAVMIAAAGWAKFLRGEFAGLDEMALPNVALA